ncbi:MAG: GNAT family N-acetyltransferase [Thermoflexibacter sp.]|uniref:Ribosomal protein S18 acetylase RimI n=1 Tax=Thermoflexibacter ruber TaxID=1003 RepID=A0A1I2DI08_9BACT|nr:GNAT family N-acetyltransferase [Thermoflexibacter ruber]SFE80164.1 Ribosomal protein S18 acetylase RimI [Thermoflexibacter ruber]
MEYTIRRGEPKDLTAAFQLIMELAIYEKGEHNVSNTPEKMLEDGFGQNPVFEFFVVETTTEKPEIVGMALTYVRYSTWRGKCLWLEDLIVTESHRQKGLGKLLLDVVIKRAVETNMAVVIWQVLDWNTPAINFYKKCGAVLEPEWINCTIYPEKLQTWQYGNF